MIEKGTFTFLKNLKKNNDRDWFNENRKNTPQPNKTYWNLLQNF